MSHILQLKGQNVKPLVNFKFLITVSIFLVIFFIILRHIFDAVGASKRIDNTAEDVVKLQDEQKRLRAELEDVQKYGFIEETARNQLNLAKKNETIVVINQDFLKKVLEKDQKPVEPKLPNWKRWLKLFFPETFNLKLF